MLTMNLNFDDISLYPVSTSAYSSREEVVPISQYRFNNGRILNGTGIIAANMDSIGTIPMAKALAQRQCFTALHKYHNREDILNVLLDKELSKYVFYTIGMNKESQEQLEWLEQFVDFNKLQVCFEVANGYMLSFIDKIESFRNKYPGCIIMAGNIITPEVGIVYKDAGVDIVKIGIGNGSACLTSSIAAIGIPQASLIDSFYAKKKYLNKYNYFICSDGGCKKYGDVTKAFALGSDFVMIGGLLSGSDEAATTKILDDNGNGFAEFYGMSSQHAMDKYCIKTKRTPEGQTIRVPYTGPVLDVIDGIIGGIKSACSYLNVEFANIDLVEKVIIK